MSTTRFILLIVLSLCFSLSCVAQQKHIGPMEVVVYDKNTPVLDSAMYIDELTLQLASMKRGDEKIIYEARIKAAEMGGNLLKVIKLKSAALCRSCYELRAEVYTVNASMLKEKPRMELRDTITRQLISDTAKYALLYIYRPRDEKGKRINCHIFIDEVEVCENGAGCVLMQDKEQMLHVWADRNMPKGAWVDVEFGKVYFLKVEDSRNGRYIKPTLTLQHPVTGYNEFRKWQY